MCGTIFQLHQFITTIFPYLFDKLKMCASSPTNFGRYINSESLKMQMNSDASSNVYLCALLVRSNYILFDFLSAYRVVCRTRTRQSIVSVYRWCAAQATCRRIIVTINRWRIYERKEWDVSPIRLQLAQCMPHPVSRQPCTFRWRW